MGTISNGITTKPFENSHALGLDWRKASRTDLDPILKDCVILAEAPDAKDHPHYNIPNGTRMVALSDDKDMDSPVLHFSRAEFTKFAEGIKAGEFDDLMATDAEMEQATAAAAV
ncbi:MULTISPECIES: DUF397 domain-containing protein [unclassified Streptomyces]|uniref:DUF397 domain-containing protein n=1 Tax=unclassified Streptomyces TaxID=2593676 RepID=UPI002DDC0A5A|nr:DUF397 domain-containing protein [Streptomyces sp. NBC_01750]WSB04200.1 DUF397 domain-containing protein [Streptomyces sp. NBC_01794]WSD31516.1 DUF397 domain-containing protein [Streptomyces sp. NBC_01750]